MHLSAVAQRQFEMVVDWGPYAELFEYDAPERVLYLAPSQTPDPVGLTGRSGSHNHNSLTRTNIGCKVLGQELLPIKAIEAGINRRVVPQSMGDNSPPLTNTPPQFILTRPEHA